VLNGNFLGAVLIAAAGALSALHVIAAWMLIAVLARETHWQVAQTRGGASAVMLGPKLRGCALALLGWFLLTMARPSLGRRAVSARPARGLDDVPGLAIDLVEHGSADGHGDRRLRRAFADERCERCELERMPVRLHAGIGVTLLNRRSAPRETLSKSFRWP
jgi:hypothetical protein